VPEVVETSLRPAFAAAASIEATMEVLTGTVMLK
jgi:hypothetical protein